MSGYALTFDVEHAVEANYSGYARGATDATDEKALASQCEVLIRACREHDRGATFFVVGNALDAFCRAWDAAGGSPDGRLEVAYHSADHRMLDEWKPEDFLARTREFQSALLSRLGVVARGFRAPSWSLTKSNVAWVYPSLRDAGFTYSSSEFRFSTGLYGPVSGNTLPFHTESGLVEVPVNPAHVLGVPVPYNGGIYGRFLPTAALIGLLRREAAQPHPKVFYLHPREIDGGSRELALSPILSFLHHHGRAGMRKKLERVLASFPWTSLEDLLSEAGLVRGARA